MTERRQVFDETGYAPGFDDGNYQCYCVNCKRTFIGHWRRHVCAECVELGRILKEALKNAEQRKDG